MNPPPRDLRAAKSVRNVRSAAARIVYFANRDDYKRGGRGPLAASLGFAISGIPKGCKAPGTDPWVR